MQADPEWDCDEDNVRLSDTMLNLNLCIVTCSFFDAVCVSTCSTVGTYTNRKCISSCC